MTKIKDWRKVCWKFNDNIYFKLGSNFLHTAMPHVTQFQLTWIPLARHFSWFYSKKIPPLQKSLKNSNRNCFSYCSKMIMYIYFCQMIWVFSLPVIWVSVIAFNRKLCPVWSMSWSLLANYDRSNTIYCLAPNCLPGYLLSSRLLV